MPKKLKRCVSKVERQGKPKPMAFGICIKTTGLMPHTSKKKTIKKK